MREARFAYIDTDYRGAPIVERQPRGRIGSATRNENANVFAWRSLRPVRAAEKAGVGEIAQVAAREIFDRLRIDPALGLSANSVVMQVC